MTPEQEEAVRRALAAEPSAGPVPPDVVARLETTLADLVEERRTTSASATPTPAEGRVVPLAAAAHGRRRRWPQVLVAAASVAVIGVGIGTVAQNLGSQSNDDSAAAGDAAPEAARDNADTDGGSAASGGDDSPNALKDDQLLYAALDRPVALSSADLANGVAGILGSSERTLTGAPDETTADAGQLGAAARLLSRCALPEAAEGDVLAAVRLDGKRSTLVVRSSESGTRVAQVYACDDPGRLLAETDVAAP